MSSNQNRIEIVPVGDSIYLIARTEDGRKAVIKLSDNAQVETVGDTDLDALAALTSTGLICRTGDGTAAARVLTGSSNEITVTNASGVTGHPTVSIASNPVMPGTGSIKVPAGTTAQRPAATKGLIRYNTSLDQYEGSTDGSTWNSIGSGGVSEGSINNSHIATDAAIVLSKLANVSATDKILGRSTAGAGAIEEIACTASGRALIDDTSTSAQRTTLGLAIGTNVQAYDADIDALAALSTSGIIARTGAGTASSRTLTGTSAQITVTNGDGVSGDPVLSLPSNVVLPGTGSLKLPIGTTAQRPSAATGLLRFNSSLSQYEGSTDGSTWTAIGAGGGSSFTEDDFYNQHWTYGA